MLDLREAVIVSAKRTPVGSFQGKLSNVKAPVLAGAVIKAILEETGIRPENIDEVIMGNVLSAGIGQAPARQASFAGGLPSSVECLTINKMCGSGLKAVMLAAQAIQLGQANVIIAGGTENMSMAPYLLPKGRGGHRLGHGKILDSIITDGLWDIYNDMHMGNCAEICARDRKYTREAQDEFARSSYEKAQKAISDGSFANEIVPVEIPQRKGAPVVVNIDEEPGHARFEKMPLLKPAFEKEGTITAANASKINDGASAVLVMDRETADSLGLKPIARILNFASAAQDPEWFTTAPIKAIQKVLDSSKLTADDIDLWEINEAFAPVTMAAMDDFNILPEKVNVNGGAIALGHPIGCSGARLLTTLLHALKAKEKSTGLVTLCIGGGEASAMIVEMEK